MGASFIPELDIFPAKIKQSLIRLEIRYIHLLEWKNHKNKLITDLKNKFKQILKNNAESHISHNPTCPSLRTLREDAIVPKNIISIFESSLTRILNMKTNELSENIIIVKTYYYEIIKDLIINGFEYNGCKYKVFTASAGQIRTKKTVFIKENLWNEHEKTLMCGLTIDEINKMGGMNVNKFLAYLALSNSATDEWENFDIDRCIVVDDFETEVSGEVDHVSDTEYTVTRKKMSIPIEHTDGCGMISPTLSTKNFMVRLPWVKGLLASFDFMRFIDVHNANPVIKDIYGQEHDLIAENIQIIFTKSQFKAHKYYDNWQQYKDNFKKFHCQAGTCKCEEDHIRSANINYQMIQTLTDIKPEEIIKIIEPAVSKLSNLTSNVGTMLEAFGAVKGRANMTPFQSSLLIYPELLEDPYCREVLKDIKQNRIKRYRHAKLPIKGKYTFLVPDLYAFCERLFLGVEIPNGLLDNGQVSCRLYPRAQKLDCLRPPHLYKEHAVRMNVINTDVAFWFKTDAIYTSSKDMISRILQFDNDGDTSLVVADETIIAAAERSMKGVVPLYYEMKKAEPTLLNNQEFFRGMSAAWSGGNIGAISNDITKIWNSGNIGPREEIAVKLLVMENNFVIDYAKTLYKPERPREINEFLRKYTKKKTPYFFKYAKGKSLNQVEPCNNSTVNKLEKLIKDKRLNFRHMMNFDFSILMCDKNINICQDVVDHFWELKKHYHLDINKNVDDKNKSNIAFVCDKVRKEMKNGIFTDEEISDILVKYSYEKCKDKYKKLLWMVYGDVILKNIQKNTLEFDPYCQKCGKRFKKRSYSHKYCEECADELIYEQKSCICADCGIIFKIPKGERKKQRCPECREARSRELARLRKEKQRKKSKIA